MNELESYKAALAATAELYISMHVLDLQEQVYTSIKTNEHILKWSEGIEGLQEVLKNVMTKLATRESRRSILEFTDLSTLEERMKDQKVLTILFRGRVNGWCNAKFIRIGEEKQLRYVMFVVENVDEQTKTFEAAKRRIEEAEKMHMITDALMDEYTTVVSCDLEADHLEVYKINGRINSLLSGQVPEETYSATMKAYIGQAVYLEDQAEMTAIMNIANLKKRMQAEGSFSKIYRNNKGVYGEMKVVRTSENTVLMGFVEKHDEIAEYHHKMYEDSLTKVRNRKYLDEILLDEHCTAIAMADIDYFKQVNDLYGHQCGDDALAAVGEALRSCVRNTDIVIRYGGDEFLMVFSDIPQDAFSEKLEMLRRRIEQIRLEAYPQLHLSMSFGGVYGNGIVSEQIASADKALYQSKKTRNEVTVLAI